MDNETLNCTLLLLRHNHEILLAMKKRGYGVGKWNGAGGKVKKGETIEQCLIRESEEEIGVTPTSFYKVAIVDFTNERKDRPVKQRVHVFIATQWGGEPEETAEMSPRWFELWDIPYDHMWEDDQLWFPLVLNGKKLHCNFKFDGDGSMVSAQINIVKEIQS